MAGTQKTQKFTKFFGYNTPLSSFRFTKFKIGNVEFPSLEHCYQYQKAKHFEDSDTMKTVLECKTPAEARKVGQKWSNADESGLLNVAFDVMWEGCLANKFHSVQKFYFHFQFTQNEGAGKYLFKTAGTTIVDCNPWNKTWGIGVSRFDHRSDDSNTWEGKNWSGKILVMVRENLMNRPEYEQELVKIESEKKEAYKENIKP